MGKDDSGCRNTIIDLKPKRCCVCFCRYLNLWFMFKFSPYQFALPSKTYDRDIRHFLIFISAETAEIQKR